MGLIKKILREFKQRNKRRFDLHGGNIRFYQSAVRGDIFYNGDLDSGMGMVAEVRYEYGEKVFTKYVRFGSNIYREIVKGPNYVKQSSELVPKNSKIYKFRDKQFKRLGM